MMKLFAVRDVKADSFGSPMAIATKGLAIRSFSDACHSPKSELSRYPNDYMLYELGEYEPNSGKITSHATPIWIASAAEMIQAEITRRTVVEPVLPGVEA